MNFENTLCAKRKTSHHYLPRTVEELLEIYLDLKKDNFKISVYSRGNNWGYGCNSPQKDDMAIIGLIKLDKVIEFDSFHGIITLEPGVSYGQLSEFLKAEGGEWITPVHGGGPDCSVVGNALERGYGLTPKTDHFGAVNSLQAILEDGSIYKGALSNLGQERLDKLFKYSIGPYLDGVFTQSGVGIVTQMTIRLAKKAEYTEMFYYNLLDESQLPEVIEVIKGIKRDLGDLVGGINLINRERALSMIIDYPLEKVKNGMPLSMEEINLFSKENTVVPWLVVGAMYGEKKLIRVAKKIIKSRFAKFKTKKLFYNTDNRNLIKTISRIFPKLGGVDVQKLESKLSDAFDILNGTPNDLALKLAYWKNENKDQLISSDMNPSKDECGLFWYAPLIEMEKGKVLEYVDFIKSASKKFGINPLITLTTLDDLCFDSTIPILFNKNNSDDVSNARKYYKYLLEEGAKKGFFPYRLNIEDQLLMSQKKDCSNPLNLKLINPYRY